MDKTPKIESTVPNSLDENNFLPDILYKLINSDPELLSKSLKERSSILSQALFDTAFKEGSDVNYNENETKKLPEIVGINCDNLTQKERSCEKYQTFKMYTLTIVVIEYLLNFSYLLDEYSKEIIGSHGGNKKKTIKKQIRKNKKTIKKRVGGVGGPKNLSVTNLTSHNQFWAWIQRRALSTSSRTPTRTGNLSTTEADLNAFLSDETLEKTRDDFYPLYDQCQAHNNRARAHNLQLLELPYLQRVTSRQQKVYDYNEYPGLKTSSEYVKKLRAFWVSTRPELREMQALQQEISTLQKQLSEPADNDIAGMNQAIRTAQLELKTMETEYNTRLTDAKERCGVYKQLDEFVGAIISIGHNGKRNVDIFKSLLRKRVIDTYMTSIDIRAQTNALTTLGQNMMQSALSTAMRTPTLEDFVATGDFGDRPVSAAELEQQYRLARAEMIRILQRQTGSSIDRFLSRLQDRATQADQAIDVMNVEFSQLREIDSVVPNFLTGLGSVGLLGLNSLGAKPGAYLYSLGKSAVDKVPYGIDLFHLAFAPGSVTPSEIDGIYTYLQIFMVAFATPSVLSALFPNNTFLRSGFYNKIVTLIQFSLLIGLIVCYSQGLSIGTYVPSLGAYAGSNVCTGSLYQFQLNCPWFLEFSYHFLQQIGISLVNNVILLPVYALQRLITSSGRPIIFAELALLLGSSLNGVRTDFVAIRQKRDELFSRAQQSVKPYTFGLDNIQELMNEFNEEMDKANLKEEKEALSRAFQTALQTRQAIMQLNLQGIQTQAAARGALAQENMAYARIAQGQPQVQPQGQLQPASLRIRNPPELAPDGSYNHPNEGDVQNYNNNPNRANRDDDDNDLRG